MGPIRAKLVRGFSPGAAAVILGAAVLTAADCGERKAVLVRSEPYSESHHRLVAAAGKCHDLQARLCGGLLAGERGKAGFDRASLRKVAAAERSINRDLAMGRTPSHLAAAAAALLLRRRPAEAATLLEEASTEQPADARLWSDLSAAYLEQAAADSMPFALVRAVSAADHALEVAPSLAEARFNLALALERLNLCREAQHAWCVASADLEGSDSWTEIARARCERTDPASVASPWRTHSAWIDDAALRGDTANVRRLVKSDPQGAREHAVDDVLARWGESEVAGREREAAGFLDIAQAIGRALASESGEFTVLDAVFAARHAEGERRLLAARAYRDYAAGRRLYQSFDVEGAVPLLQRVVALSATLPSPEPLWAALWLGGSAMHQARYDDAIEQLDAILESPSRARYPALVALSHWLLGTIRLRTGRVADALGEYRAAEAILRPLGERQNLGGIYSLIAETLDYLGQSRLSWSYRDQALAVLRFYPSSVQLQNLLRDGVRVLLGASEPRAALYFQKECALTAASSGNAVTAADAYLQGCRIEQNLGRQAAARADLGRAREQIGGIAGGTLRERMLADSAWVSGTLEGETDARRGLALLTEAADYYGARHLDLNLEPVLLARARLWLVTGADRSAEADLRQGIERFESRRGTITDRSLRLSSLQTAVELFDEMMSLQVDRRHDVRAAFDYAERARAALSFPSTAEGRRAGAPASATALPGSLSGRLSEMIDRPIVIEYAVLADRLYIWSFDRHGFRFLDRHINMQALREKAYRFIADLRRGAPAGELAPFASSLFDELVAPLAAKLETGSPLIIVPDKFLNGIPFAALLDRTTKRYLLEDHPVSMAPQASLLLDRSARRPPAPRLDGRKVLLVASPLFNRQEFPWLAPLPGADQEVARVAAVYPGAVVIQGKAATRAAFIAALMDASVLHFVGHALAAVADPDDAQIVLAPSRPPGGADTLSGRDLRGLSFPHLRLVVLSACSTTAPDATRSGGLFGLARPFLEGGVAAVVGTLWSIDDRFAPEVLESFHRGIVARQTVARSLRLAQLRLLHSGDPRAASPASWAAFCVIETKQN
jgi:CHAT domain-containing protein